MVTSLKKQFQRLAEDLDAGDKDFLTCSNEASENVSSESFSELFQKINSEVKPGMIVTGKVVGFSDNSVVLDIGYKSEGVVSKSEFPVVDKGIGVGIGDEVDLYVEEMEDRNGVVVLSKDRASILKAWDKLLHSAETEEVIDGKVISKVKGGLYVDIGVKAFLPGSQVETYPVKDLSPYIGNTYPMKIIKFSKERGNIVLSRRAVLDQEREHIEKISIEDIKEDSVLSGLIKNVTSYGVFIDLGGVDGLLHITDMSWNRIKHPAEVLPPVGQKVEVKVLKVDVEQRRVNLGLKQLTEDPWQKVIGKYSVGTKLKGKILSIVDYGVFVQIEEGLEGLVHVSEMSWDKKFKTPSQLVKEGEEVEVVVSAIDDRTRRVSLSMKQLQENPWKQLMEAYPVNTVIEGKVKAVTDFGIFVGIAEDVDGLVHISDISWTKRIDHPSKMYNVGDTVQTVVLKVDSDGGKISLGVKQLKTNPWDEIEARCPIGSQHEVVVNKIMDFGVFVDIGEGIEGMIHVSELSVKRVNSPEDVVKIGDKIKAEVVSIDKESRRISLSLKLAQRSASAVVDSQGESEAFSGPLGEALQNAVSTDSDSITIDSDEETSKDSQEPSSDKS